MDNETRIMLQRIADTVEQIEVKLTEQKVVNECLMLDGEPLSDVVMRTPR